MQHLFMRKKFVWGGGAETEGFEQVARLVGVGKESKRTLYQEVGRGWRIEHVPLSRAGHATILSFATTSKLYNATMCWGFCDMESHTHKN